MLHYAAFFPPGARECASSCAWPAARSSLLIAASALAADPAKVLRISFPVAETGFDPVRVSDLYSNTVNEAIFERLLTYDYLARPARSFR
jgi:ABC-type oligopeptide transport system substrate-binding subunit